MAVGAPDTALPLLGTPLEKITLPGDCVIPGLVDAHVHLARYLLPFVASLSVEKLRQHRLNAEEYGWLNLQQCSREQLLTRVQEKARRTPPGSWIVGGGWDRALVRPLPLRQELDQVAPLQPVFLADYSLHAALVNSPALQLAGINDDTWDPRGGKIERDPESGVATGRLYEYAVPLVENKIPALPTQIRQKILALLMAYLNSLGLTGVHDMESRAEYDIFPALAQLYSQEPHKFTLRCVTTLKYNTFATAIASGICPGTGNDYLRVGPLKIIHDGSLGAGTALMSRPYAVTGGSSPYWGEEVITRGELQYIAREACRRHIPLAIHAIGDRATQNIAEILEELGYGVTSRPLRHRIEHIQHASPQTLERLAQCGVVFSVQPLHLLDDFPRVAQVAPWLLESTHTYRAMRQMSERFQTQVAFGTDFPVVPPQPLWTMYTAVTRRFPDGRTLPQELVSPQDLLTPDEAVSAYTVGSAFAVGEELNRGSLSAGKLADFVVLSDDILRKEPETMLTAQVLATFVGGRQVFPAQHDATQ